MFAYVKDHVVEFVLGAVIALLVLLIPFVVYATALEQRAFMEECERDHKHYECQALWRSGDRAPTVVPMPVVVPR